MGALNFIPWNERVTLLLEELRIWDITKEVVTITTNTILLEEYQRKNMKEKCILLDVVKGHIMPHVTRKNNAFDMWEALIKFFQSHNQNLKMVLRAKLRGTKMTKTGNVTSYLTHII